MSERKALPIDEDVRLVFDMAHAKYIKGEEKHGPLDLKTDPRNFYKEAIDELLDSMVYTSALIINLMKIEARLNGLIDDKDENRL